MKLCLHRVRPRIKKPRPLWKWPPATKAILKRRAARERGLQFQLANIREQQAAGMETASVRKAMRRRWLKPASEVVS